MPPCVTPLPPAGPHWAALAVPTYDHRYRRFFQHLLTTLGIGYDPDEMPSIGNFDPLLGAIREQATWDRLLSDPDWGTLIESHKAPRVVRFIDIANGYGRSAWRRCSPTVPFERRRARSAREDGQYCGRMPGSSRSDTSRRIARIAADAGAISVFGSLVGEPVSS
jgi:hypothetical protein